VQTDSLFDRKLYEISASVVNFLRHLLPARSAVKEKLKREKKKMFFIMD